MLTRALGMINVHVSNIVRGLMSETQLAVKHKVGYVYRLLTNLLIFRSHQTVLIMRSQIPCFM